MLERGLSRVGPLVDFRQTKNRVRGLLNRNRCLVAEVLVERTDRPRGVEQGLLVLSVVRLKSLERKLRSYILEQVVRPLVLLHW